MKRKPHANMRLTKRIPRITVIITLVVVLVVGLSAVMTLSHRLMRNLDRSLGMSVQVMAQNLDDPQELRLISMLREQAMSGAKKAKGKKGKGKQKEKDVEASAQPTPLPTDPGPSGGPHAHGPHLPPETLWARGAFAETIHIVTSKGVTRAGRLNPQLQVEPLTQRQIDVIEHHVGRVPSTVLVPDLGLYRIVQMKVSEPKKATAIITVGLPMGDAVWTIVSFIGWWLVYAALGVVLAWVVSRFIVRRELRPLAQVADTANAVRRVNLQRSSQLPKRVSSSIVDVDSEAGDVGRALNVALQHIEDALAEREASERKLRQFIADASHELRTPIATISGYAQLMDGEVSEEAVQSLKRIRSESDRMSALVNNLLTLARLDRGEPVEERDIDVAAIVVEAVADAHVSAPNYEWSADLCEDADSLQVVGDPMKLRQVLANLLANATQHTPSGTHVTVMLDAPAVGELAHAPAWLGPSRQVVRIRVADTGPGIADDMKERVFDRFTRADSARTPGESTGLGLSIVKAIVEAHRGSVCVEDTPGGGATFTIVLPRKELSAPRQPSIDAADSP